MQTLARSIATFDIEVEYIDAAPGGIAREACVNFNFRVTIPSDES